MAAYCTPTYGTGLTVGWLGSAESIDFECQLRERSGFLILGVLIERGARSRRHPRPAILGSDELGVFLARRPGDELLGRLDLLRAGGNGEVPGPEPVRVLSQAVVRRQREADIVGDLGLLRIGDEGRGNRRVDPHAALAGVEQSQILVEAVGARARRTGVMHEVYVGGQRRLPFRGVELRLPLFVEPARAVGIGHGGEERHVLAPAGFAAQAYAIHACGFVGELLRRVEHEIPGRCVRHRQPGLLEQVGAVHRKRAFAVEWRGVELAADCVGVADLRQQIAGVIARAELVERYQPVLLAPDRHLVRADGENVELAALGGDVGGDALAQNILLQRDPIDGDVRVLRGEVAGQALHADHVAVVDRRDGQRGLGEARGGGEEG